MGHLLGLTEDVSLPAPLNEDWDRETIVERFKTEFELDHRFMLSLHASLDQCREVCVLLPYPRLPPDGIDELRGGGVGLSVVYPRVDLCSSLGM